jgi:hypothetical protein
MNKDHVLHRCQVSDGPPHSICRVAAQKGRKGGACAVGVFRFISLLITFGAFTACAFAFSSCYMPLGFL